MTIIPLVIVIVMFLVALYFRQQIADAIIGAGCDITAAWLTIWPAIRITFWIAMSFGLIGLILLFTAMYYLGTYANSLPSAVVLTVLSPIWFMAFLVPPVGTEEVDPSVFRRVAGLVRMLCTPVLLFATLFLSIGLWSPEIKESADKFSGTKKIVTASSIDQGTLKESLKKDSKIIAVLKNEAPVFDSFGKSIQYKDGNELKPLRFKKGTRVRVLERIADDGVSEAIARVMFPNSDGKFIGGFIACVAVSDLDENS